jgi:alkaline phosphatase
VASRLRQFLVHAGITLLALAAALFAFSFFGGTDLALGPLVLRAQRGSTYPLAAPASSKLAASPVAAASLPPLTGRPRNVILFIGDGMGVGHVSAAGLLLDSPGAPIAMTSLAELGLMQTWAANNLATDSAASGTAIATGFKTNRKLVGKLADGRAVRNIFEAARVRGLATGIITTSGLVDATPACFTAHVDSRDDFDSILEQMLASGTEILVGGDFSYYRKARHHRRYQEMLADLESLAARRGYTVVRDREALASCEPPLVGLFPPRPQGPPAHGPPLAVTLRRAVELLGNDPEGFMLLVESEVIDETGHVNDIAGSMAALRELDEAVATALELTRGRDDTLVIVTADHDTGTLALVDGDYAEGRTVVRWATGEHSAQWVPVFASGPGSGLFAGLLDNTDLSPRIARLLGLETLPRLAEERAD